MGKMIDITPEVRKKIKETAKALGGQKKLAEQTGLFVGTISKIIRGITKQCTSETHRKLINCYLSLNTTGGRLKPSPSGTEPSDGVKRAQKWGDTPEGDNKNIQRNPEGAKVEIQFGTGKSITYFGFHRFRNPVTAYKAARVFRAYIRTYLDENNALPTKEMCHAKREEIRQYMCVVIPAAEATADVAASEPAPEPAPESMPGPEQVPANQDSSAPALNQATGTVPVTVTGTVTRYYSVFVVSNGDSFIAFCPDLDNLTIKLDSLSELKSAVQHEASSYTAEDLPLSSDLATIEDWEDLLQEHNVNIVKVVV